MSNGKINNYMDEDIQQVEGNISQLAKMLRTTSKSEMSKIKSQGQRKNNKSNRYSVVEENKKDPLLDYVRPKKKCFIDFGL